MKHHWGWVVSLGCLIGSLICAQPASAKITAFTNEEALRQLLASDTYEKQLKDFGELKGLTIKQSTAEGLPTYVFNLSYTVKTDLGTRSCFARATIQTETDRSEQGIVSSHLGDPQLLDIVCEP
jgi:hypothetical protein